MNKVRSGQPLAITAGDWNAFIDAANDYRVRSRSTGVEASPLSNSSGIISVRNESGSARNRFDVLGLSAPIFPPAGNAATRSTRSLVAFRGVTPATANHKGRFAILLEPLAAGAIGQAIASGVCPVRLYVSDTTTIQSDVTNGDASRLTTSPTGSATILWRESGSSGTVWAVVRIGTPASESAAGPAMARPARIVNVGAGFSLYYIRWLEMDSSGQFQYTSDPNGYLATNLAELQFGKAGAVDLNTIVLVYAILDTSGNTRYVFDHPIYAKYLD